MAQAAPEKPSTLAAFLVFLERPTLVMLALGFAAGLPNLLIFDTLSAWLREAGLELTVIGYFSLATLSYSLKFLWAPVVDRTAIPGLTPLLGHRRSWMLVAQAAIILGLVAISGSNPAANLGAVALLAVVVAFSSATQDIVIDAWRIEAAGEERQGAMAAAYQWGYRIAILTAGIAPLLIAQQINWGVAYVSMAALMGVGVAAVLLAPREKPRPALPPALPQDMPKKPLPEALEWAARLLLLAAGALLFGAGFTGSYPVLSGALGFVGLGGVAEALQPAWTARPGGVFLQFAFVLAGGALIFAAARPFPRMHTRPGVYFDRSYGDPFRDFFSRFEGTAGLILAMICCYRLSDFVLNIMNPFYLDVGFALNEIAEIRKGFGVLMLMLGVGVAGWAVARFGLIKPLIVGAFASPLTNLVFAWMATAGPDWRVFATAIAIDNVTSGYAGTVLIAYMSSLTSAGFTATQYALFSSLYALPGKLIAAQSGAIVESGARMAEAGGLTAPLVALVSALPAESFAEGAARIGVAQESLAAGYIAFFLYSCAIGAIAIWLAFVIASKQEKRRRAGEASAAATAAE